MPRSILKWLPAAVLAVGILAGCGDRHSAEMREQATLMTTETAEWNAQLGRWEQDMKEESSWLSSHPAPPADAGKADALREHEERLTKHEQDVARYRQELGDHVAALKREDNQSEQVRTESHDARWTEHQKLKASFTMLKNQHEELLREHESMLTAGNVDEGKEEERR